jgi:hypothetical protein
MVKGVDMPDQRKSFTLTNKNPQFILHIYFVDFNGNNRSYDEAFIPQSADLRGL